jgi:hypothetical protein
MTYSVVRAFQVIVRIDWSNSERVAHNHYTAVGYNWMGIRTLISI